MVIKEKQSGDVVVLTVDGEINFNSSPEFRKSFLKVLDSKNLKVVVNLLNVAYVDSSGLATLVEAHQKIKSAGGKLKLTNLSPKVKGLFEITKLEKLFDIQPNEEDAVKSF
ncbi:MAG: STAS domain-containing protein [Candidatus Omnitrophota bacterium]|jgi:anti-sigma B factor antagonist